MHAIRINKEMLLLHVLVVTFCFCNGSSADEPQGELTFKRSLEMSERYRVECVTVNLMSIFDYIVSIVEVEGRPLFPFQRRPTCHLPTTVI